MKRKEILLAASAGICLTLTAWGESLTLAQALVDMQAGAANPVTTSDGTWSVYNTRNTVYLIPSTVTSGDVDLPRIAKDASGTLPTFVGNPTEGDVVYSSRTIPSGACYWHPDYNGTDDVVFKPKESGVYTMTLYMKDLAGGAPENQGPGVSGTIYVNDGKIGEVVVALESCVDFPTEDRVSIEHVALAEGDTVKLSLGSRGNNWDDATIVEFKMTREDAWAVNFAQRLSAMVPDAETIVNPMTVEGEGTWDVQWRWSGGGKSMDVSVSDSDGAARGLVGDPSSKYPVLVANCTTASTKYGTTTIPCGSIYFHPDNNASRSTAIRFVPQDTATYSIVADITDTGDWIGAGDEGGVNVAAWTIGARMDGNASVCETNVWVCLEKGVPTGRLELLDHPLAEGQSIEIRLDNNGKYDSDSTLIRLTVWQVAGTRAKDRRVEGLHEFSPAYVAALKADELSPTFQDVVGGTWQVGWTEGLDGAFSQSVKLISAQDGVWLGWVHSSKAQPYVYANVSAEAHKSPGNYGSYLPGECILHPIGGTGEAFRYAAVRFTAPADGLSGN